MDEVWLVCDEFPDYSLSSFGRVANTKHSRIIKPIITKEGTVKVKLYLDGVQHTKSLKVLLGNAFISGRTNTFNTIINLDGNLENNNITNLIWRPRWFAWKYRRQLENVDHYTSLVRGLIFDRKTNLVYDGIVNAGLTNGLLFSEILLSLHDQTPVFPTWQVFGEVEE